LKEHNWLKYSACHDEQKHGIWLIQSIQQHLVSFFNLDTIHHLHFTLKTQCFRRRLYLHHQARRNTSSEEIMAVC